MKTNFIMKWRERLCEKGDISKFDKKTTSWQTCGIGERVFLETGRRMRNYTNSLTKEAYDLGIDFDKAVQNNDVKKAQKILSKIEDLPTVWKSKKTKTECPFCKQEIN